MTAPRGTPAARLLAPHMLPHSIVIERRDETDGTYEVLAAQAVRVGNIASAGERSGGGLTPGTGSTVYGAADLDIARGDVFLHAGIQYRVVMVEAVNLGVADGGEVLTKAAVEAVVVD